MLEINTCYCCCIYGDTCCVHGDIVVVLACGKNWNKSWCWINTCCCWWFLRFKVDNLVVATLMMMMLLLFEVKCLINGNVVMVELWGWAFVCIQIENVIRKLLVLLLCVDDNSSKLRKIILMMIFKWWSKILFCWIVDAYG